MSRAVLVVCVGNICRSPMAALLLQSRVREVEISSAGVAALVGEGADPMSISLMADRGLDLSGHVARQLDESVLKCNDMVLTMEDAHTRWITEKWPHFTGRVFKWGHWENFDVPDPFRRGDDAFRESLRLIDRGLQQWADKLEKLSS